MQVQSPLPLPGMVQVIMPAMITTYGEIELEIYTSMLKTDVKCNMQAKTYVMYKYNMYTHLQHKL